MSDPTRRLIAGFKLPSDDPLTANEKEWIAFLRLIFNDMVPPPAPSTRLRLTAKVKDLP